MFATKYSLDSKMYYVIYKIYYRKLLLHDLSTGYVYNRVFIFNVFLKVISKCKFLNFFGRITSVPCIIYLYIYTIFTICVQAL